MADLTRDALARLREVNDKRIAADTAYNKSRAAYGSEEEKSLCLASCKADDAFNEAIYAAMPALLAAAERDLDLDRREGLVFGPWHEGERHAVAVDGAHYTLFAMRDPEDPMTRWETTVWTEEPNEGDCDTEAEAIDAARAHDVARRGGK